MNYQVSNMFDCNQDYVNQQFGWKFGKDKYFMF